MSSQNQIQDQSKFYNYFSFSLIFLAATLILSGFMIIFSEFMKFWPFIINITSFSFSLIMFFVGKYQISKSKNNIPAQTSQKTKILKALKHIIATTPPKIKVKATTPPKIKVKATTPPKIKVKANTPPKIKVKATTPPKIKVKATTPPKIKVKATTPPKIKVKANTPPKVCAKKKSSTKKSKSPNFFTTDQENIKIPQSKFDYSLITPQKKSQSIAGFFDE
jgi:hypothetical protein